MFSFFSKKEFLVDYLEGFVDIHNHILPGIDDGAKNVEESIALLKGFSEFGVKDFICTPHIMENYYPNNYTSINKSLSVLKNGLKMNDMNEFNIRVAAEHMIDSNFENLLAEKKVMPLADNYLLIEMSYLQASINFEFSIEKIKNQNFFPVFAHPERYVYLQNAKGIYDYYKNKGVQLQLNMLSIGGYYGKNVQKTALKLLKSASYDFIASDVHRIEHLSSIKNTTVDNKTKHSLLRLIQNTTNTFT